MQRPVTFYSDGLKLDGVLYLPDSIQPGQRVPGIVICHGFTQHKEIFGLSYANSLHKYGFACLTFDYRGFGGSEGERGRLIPWNEVRDARNALTWMEAQPEVDPDKLGLLGTSFGGAVVLMTGVVDQRPKAIVSFDGIGSGRRWLRGQRAGWDWARFLAQLKEDRVQRVLNGKGEWQHYPEITGGSPGSVVAHNERKQQYPDWQDTLPLETAEQVIEFNPEDRAHEIAPRAVMVIYDPNPSGFAGEEAHEIYLHLKEPRRIAKIPPGGKQYSHYFGEELEYWIKLCADWYTEHLVDHPIAVL